MKILSIFGGAFFLIGVLLVVVGTMLGGSPFQIFLIAPEVGVELVKDALDDPFDIYDDMFFWD